MRLLKLLICADHNQVDSLIGAALQHAKNNIDKARILELRLRAKVAESELPDAIEIGHEVLALLDVPITSRLHILHLAVIVRILLSISRQPKKLDTSSVMTDKRLLIAMRVLMDLSQAGYISGDSRTPLYVLKMTDLSLKHGMAPESSFAFPMFGSLLISFLGTIDFGYQFGQMALENLNEGNKHLHCKTMVIVTNFINVWKHHLKETLEPLSQAHRLGVETGDVEFSLIASVTSSANAFVLGHDLNSLETNLAVQSARSLAAKQNSMRHLSDIYRQAAINLLHENAAP